MFFELHLLLSLEWLSSLEHVIQSLFNKCFLVSESWGHTQPRNYQT